MPHYYKDKELLGWGPTVEEIDNLANIFNEIVHLGVLIDESAPLNTLRYGAKNIKFIPLKPSGGNSIIDKFTILKYLFQYIRIISKWLQWADFVHLRCPANIPLIALLILSFEKKPKFRWVKYAGNWSSYPGEALSYKCQKWILKKNFLGGFVTINGDWPNQESHIFSFKNPSLTEKDVENGKIIARQKELNFPIKIIFVGRVESAKGVGRILQIAKNLKEAGLAFTIEIIGDGEEKVTFQKMAENMYLTNQVLFLGWLSKEELASYYKEAQIILFPSSASEGWPKVLSEAMAYGVVPIASRISSIPQILAKYNAGIAVPVDHLDDYVKAILNLSENPKEWKKMSLAGAEASYNFSYPYYLKSVKRTFENYYQVDFE